MPCCNEISSIPASPEASGSWSLWARRRPSRSRFATFRAGDAGRSSTNGFGSARPPDRRIHRRQIKARREQASFNNRKFVAGLALRRLCLRRAGALHGSEIQVEQGLLFVALVFVLLAQAQDFPEDFHIEALSLGLREDFLFALIQRLDLFVDAFNALDEGANAIAWDSGRVCHACSFVQEGIRCSDESHREVNREASTPYTPSTVTPELSLT